MGHYDVVVCGPRGDRARIEDLLRDVMLPWSEHVDVLPWREYLMDTPVGYANRCGLLIDGGRAGRGTTWRQVAEVANRDCVDDEDLIWVDENEDAYRVCTWNRDSRWEGWWIGREQLRFRHTVDADADALIDPLYGLCDGGPRQMLDLDGMRGIAERKARWECAYWNKIRATTPAPTLWPAWLELVGEGEMKAARYVPKLGLL